MRSGRKSAAQTKAPLKDRIKGSDINKKGSASSTAAAKDIVLSDEIIKALQDKADEFNQKNKQNKVSLSTLKAVFRRGAGAFSTSHRPNMTRNGWAYARVNKFLEKKEGKMVKKSYIQDNDLMSNGGITTSTYKTIASFDDSSVIIYDGNLGYMDILKLTNKLPKNIKNIEVVLKESSDLEALTIWSQEKVKESFGSEFESGFPMIYSTKEKGQLNLKKAYGELKNGKKVIFDVDNLQWEEGDIEMANGGKIDLNGKKWYRKYNGTDPFSYNKEAKTKYGSGIYFSSQPNSRFDGEKEVEVTIDYKNPKIYESTKTIPNRNFIKDWRQNHSGDEMNKFVNGLFDGGHDAIIVKHGDTFGDELILRDNSLIKYEKGGLIAPNGKISNLTEEQYKLVRTPQFKAWFGDWENDPQNASKVVDDNGEPLVVYHGSANKFYVFDKKRVGENYRESEQGGFFFTQKLNTAKNYARLHTNLENDGFVYYCFLNIKNPLVKNTNSEYYSPADRYDISRSEYIIELRLNEKIDGVIIFGTKKDNLYVVNNPNQIKLADGTNTTFDSNSNDIRYEKGGQLSIDDNGLMDSVFPEIRDAFKNNGLKLEKNYSFTDGSNKSYLPHTGIYKTNGEVEKVGITYYDFGFEVLGEIIVEVQDNGAIDIKIEFPNWQVSEVISIYARGGQIDKMHKKIKEEMLNETFKSHKDIEQIANEKGVDLDYAEEQLRKGMKIESEHSNDPMVQEIIALQHLDEMIDYYQKLEFMEASIMERGGNINLK